MFYLFSNEQQVNSKHFPLYIMSLVSVFSKIF